MVCWEVCRQVPLIIQEEPINEDLYVLSIERTNIMLGIQWLEKLGAVTCNYQSLAMKFQHEGKHICKQGDTQSQILSGSLRSLVDREQVAYFCHLQGDPVPNQEENNPWAELQEIIQKFPTIMQERTELPTWKPFNHHILLSPEIKPINVNPYRYPHIQKSEIERLTKGSFGTV